MNIKIDYLKSLFFEWSGKQPLKVLPLPPSGSERRYFRLQHNEINAIGVWHPIREENRAFLYFSHHFRSHGLHVPKILGYNEAHQVYLLEDLGDTSLFSLVEESLKADPFPSDLSTLYRKSLTELIQFQVIASKDLDYSFCYPRSSFDKQSMLWDLQYFKYYYLKLHTSFHEEKLEHDFNSLVRFLSQANADFFMYRDFQSRNILIRDGQPYFIDYQGGRKGPLQYDIASLLFQVKARLPADVRDALLEFYLFELEKHIAVDKLQFKKHYDGFVLIRLLQVLGAYGFRGMIERKPHFLQSIPLALESLKWWLNNNSLKIKLTELTRILEIIVNTDQYDIDRSLPAPGAFTVNINSFSYNRGIPADNSGHGGGFVFDCRALPNPGREEKYRILNGKDKIIVEYFEKSPEAGLFLEACRMLVSSSVEVYLERNFSHLSVNFGCTGGQHRSVYCAEHLAGYLRKKYPEVSVLVNHTNLNRA